MLLESSGLRRVQKHQPKPIKNVSQPRQDHSATLTEKSIRKKAFSRQIQARYNSAQRLKIRSRKKSISTMGCFNSKHEEDENCLRIEDLPNEMMVEIFFKFEQ